MERKNMVFFLDAKEEIFDLVFKELEMMLKKDNYTLLRNKAKEAKLKSAVETIELFNNNAYVSIVTDVCINKTESSIELLNTGTHYAKMKLEELLKNNTKLTDENKAKIRESFIDRPRISYKTHTISIVPVEVAQSNPKAFGVQFINEFFLIKDFKYSELAIKKIARIFYNKIAYNVLQPKKKEKKVYKKNFKPNMKKKHVNKNNNNRKFNKKPGRGNFKKRIKE